MWWYRLRLILGVLTFRMKLIEARIVWKMIGLIGTKYHVTWYESGSQYNYSYKKGVDIHSHVDSYVYQWYQTYQNWNSSYDPWKTSGKRFPGIRSETGELIFVNACVLHLENHDEEFAREKKREADLALRKSAEETLQRLQK